MEHTKNLFKKNLTKKPVTLKIQLNQTLHHTLNVGLIDSFFRPILLMFKIRLIIKVFNFLGYIHKQIIRDGAFPFASETCWCRLSNKSSTSWWEETDRQDKKINRVRNFFIFFLNYFGFIRLTIIKILIKPNAYPPVSKILANHCFNLFCVLSCWDRIVLFIKIRPQI